jgi:predicted ester cyclase
MADHFDRYKGFIDEVVLGYDLTKLEEYVAPGFVEHEEFPGVPNTIEAVRVFVTAMNEGFSDLTWTIEDWSQDADKLWVRSTVGGTHTGTFLGIPATNKPFRIDVIDVLRLEDGRAAEHWGVTDTAGMLTQLGVMEQPTL